MASNVKAAGLRGENLPIVSNYVVEISTQQTPLLRVRLVFEQASQGVQDEEIDIRISKRNTAIRGTSLESGSFMDSLSKIP